MPPKKQHHKTQSSEISPQAIMSYLSNREAFQARLSNSPTLQLELKQKQLAQQFSPMTKQVTSMKMSSAQQNLLNSMMRQTSRKAQDQQQKTRGFMSPKIVQERQSLKTMVKQGGHIKTQPHSHQNSQSNLKKMEKLQEEYFSSQKSQQRSQQPSSAKSKIEQSLKQRVEMAVQELKQRTNEDVFLKKQIGLAQSAKNQNQIFMSFGHQQKVSSAQYVEQQKFQTHSSSQPLIEFMDKNKPVTTSRKPQQEMLTIVIVYKTFKQKYAIDISFNKIQWLIDFVKQEVLKALGTSAPQIIGIKTANISIPIDYILSKPDMHLNLLADSPQQPLMIEPVLYPDNESKAPRQSLKDFEFIRCIGMGGFSKVYMVREKKTGQFYAMKLIEKKPILQQNKQSIIQNERDIMSILNHPFIVGLQYAFESRKYLVFVLEYCSGGELFYLLRKVKRMSEEEAFFYFAEICLGMKNLHENNIIYRDIKPENILIDFEGHVRIADFGLSKPHMSEQDVAYSFCGSPEYMAPEMLLKSGHNLQLDLYCLGALLYELVTGLPPFYSRNTDEIYQRILNQKLTFPSTLQMSNSIKDLLSGLLAKNPRRRIDSIDNLLKHPWMTQWGDKHLLKDLLQRKIDPPFKPDQFGFNFDEEEFGKGESEFLQSIRPLQQNVAENFPKDIILKNFYYDNSEARFQESTGGTVNNMNLRTLDDHQSTTRFKQKRINTIDDHENTQLVLSEQKQIFLMNQLRLQTENESKRRSA
ncbi:hypothetical protein pb186bvf_018742 [Paramecium bursaria]